MLNTPRVGALFLLLAVVLLSAWLMRPALPIVALAALYAFITWPVAKRLSVRMPLWLAIMLANVGVALGLLAFLVVIGPMVYVQAHSLLGEMPKAFSSAVALLPDALRSTIQTLVQGQAASLALWSREALQASVGVVRSAAGLVGAALLIPVLAAYFQHDAPRYEAAMMTVVPPERRAAFSNLLREVAGIGGAFFRAQLLVSAIVGVLVYIALAITGVPFAPTIAFITAVADLVPYLGGIAAFIPSLILAFAFGGLWKALLVGALLAAIFEFEAQILQPQIVGSKTHLPSSAVVVALLLGGSLFGIVGLYLAVPISASLPAIVRFVLAMPSPQDRARIAPIRRMGSP